MKKPDFITFTGVDERTPFSLLNRLSQDYPVEWGVLFSPKRQGLEARYPSMSFIVSLLNSNPQLRFAAHLCGGAAREVIDNGRSSLDALLRPHVSRVQINTTGHANPRDLRIWGDSLSVGVILQCRASFPLDDKVEWLFDKSGGKGIVESIWPQPIPGRTVGYAGGLAPHNVAQALPNMIAGASDECSYWIDMESGVRDSRDYFDIDRCQAVCEAVYGKAS